MIGSLIAICSLLVHESDFGLLADLKCRFTKYENTGLFWPSKDFVKLLTSAFDNELVTWNVRMYTKILPNIV